MSWQVLLAISMVLLSLNGLFHRSLLKDEGSDPRAQTIAFLGLGGIIAIVIALLRGKLDLTFPQPLLINFILIAVLSTVHYITKYRGFQLIGASEVVIFSTTSKLWNVFGAAIFLHESITFAQVLGAVVILFGIAITLYSKKKFQLNGGIAIVLFSAFLVGLTDINGYYILRQMDASNFQIYAWLLPVFAILITQPQSIKKLKFYLNRTRGPKVALLSLFDTLGNLAFFFSFQAGGKASIIGPLSATKVLITVLLAAVLLGEKENLTNKIIGAIVTVIGVILLL